MRLSKKVTKQGEVLEERRMGGQLSPASSSSSSPKDSYSERVSPPPPPCLYGIPGHAFEPFFLLSHVLPFIRGVVGLLPHHILEQGDPPWVAAHESKP
jgi:hypothetical protein